MISDAVAQTLWAELVIGTLGDAGVATIVISPGSRSTPLVAALPEFARSNQDVITIIDERAAAFYALGVARATGLPAALVCTSGTAAAHYLPALVEASVAAIPLIAITADRPPELQGCGASQTIDQVKLFGDHVRAMIDLGGPVGGELALRAVRRKIIQAVTLARGPHPGPVHVEVPLRKPLEPAAPATEAERALAAYARGLRGPVQIAVPRLVADGAALDALAAAIDAEPDGAIVVGSLPVAIAEVAALAARTGYPVIAESGSQLRFGALAHAATPIDALDVVPLARRPVAKLIVQLGGEPVAASWPAWSASAPRWVLAAHAWHDPDSSARGVIVGDVAMSLAHVVGRVASRANAAWLASWRAVERDAAAALEQALAAHPGSEGHVVRAAIAAMPANATLQLGNSLPIRVVDQVARRGDRALRVITQRGAAGIDGLVASAAGATHAGHPVLLVLGDVSFAHDLGALVAARTAAAPLAIVVVDNAGGQIFAGLPIARTASPALVARHFTTAPELDPVAIAIALGARGVLAQTPGAVAAAVATALATGGVTVIHAPVTASGAHDVRRTAVEHLLGTP